MFILLYVDVLVADQRFVADFVGEAVSGECSCEVLTGCRCVQCDGYEPSKKDVCSRHMMYRIDPQPATVRLGWRGRRGGCGVWVLGESLDGGW